MGTPLTLSLGQKDLPHDAVGYELSMTLAGPGSMYFVGTKFHRMQIEMKIDLFQHVFPPILLHILLVQASRSTQSLRL